MNVHGVHLLYKEVFKGFFCDFGGFLWFVCLFLSVDFDALEKEHDPDSDLKETWPVKVFISRYFHFEADEAVKM